VDSLILQLEAQRGAGTGELTGLSFGVPSAVQILRQCDRATERATLTALEERSPEIAERISQGIFSSMEDLKWLEPRALQMVLRRIEMKELALALRGANEQIRELCLTNLSENMAADIREEIDSGSPRPRREVEAAQDQILSTVRKLAEEGEIDLGGGEDLV